MSTPERPPRMLAPRPPVAFVADVQQAVQARAAGKLSLLGAEAQPYPWQRSATLLVGAELLGLQAFRSARLLCAGFLSAVPEDHEIRELLDRAEAGEQQTASPWRHAILFTGHRIDAPGRSAPRFPASAEAAAREAMKHELRQLIGTDPGSTIGLAGGASGGDLLFHELCAELGIPTRLRLTLPPAEFIEASVAPSGPGWVRRLQGVLHRLGARNVEILVASTELPVWMLPPQASYDVWQRTNLWLLHDAIAHAPRQTLLALWDGEQGDGPGGTGHLVQVAPQYGVAVAPLIDPRTLES